MRSNLQLGERIERTYKRTHTETQYTHCLCDMSTHRQCTPLDTGDAPPKIRGVEEGKRKFFSLPLFVGEGTGYPSLEGELGLDRVKGVCGEGASGEGGKAGGREGEGRAWRVTRKRGVRRERHLPPRVGDGTRPGVARLSTSQDYCLFCCSNAHAALWIFLCCFRSLLVLLFLYICL